MASLQVNLSTGEVGMAGGGGYFSSNVAFSGVQIADANGDLTNLTANTIFASNLNVIGDFVTMNTITSNTERVDILNSGTGPALKVTQGVGISPETALTVNQESSGNILQLQQSGVNKVSVLESGFVGIGTAAPQSALDVIGSIKATTSIMSDTQFLGQAADTASTPSFSFTANPNTGIFQPATSNLALSTGGIERLRVSSNGFVGIGTSSPTSALDVIGSASISSNLVVSGNITASNIRVLGDYVILDTITSNTEQMVITNDGTGPALKVTQTGVNSIAEFYDDDNALAFKVANDGLVGIGTANPLAKLHVVGSIKATTSISSDTQFLGKALDTEGAPSFSFTANPNTGIFQPATSNLAVSTGGTERLRVASNGNVGIGTTIPQSTLDVIGSLKATESILSDTQFLGQANDTASAPSFSFVANPDTGIFQPAVSNIALSTGGTERLRVSSNGNVGIGTTTPQTALDVIGSTSISSNLVVSGNITASNIRVLGDYVILDTITSNTEQMVITNDGTGPALKVTQTGMNSIAEFYDDDNALALKVANNGLVGIGTSDPLEKLHVVGSIKATTSIMSDTQFLGQSYDTASAPSFSFIANPDTGIFQPATSNLAVSTGGTERLRVSSNGNVGIGTVAPQNKLDVIGSIKATANISSDTQFLGQASDTAGTPSFSFAANPNTGIFQPLASNIALSTGGTERLRVSSNGFVGVGTTNPQEILDVVGSIKATANISSDTQFLGQVGDTAGTPSFSFVANPNTGIFQPAVSNIALSTGGTERLRVSSNGFVGIGTVDPQSALHVIGSTSISSNLVVSGNITASNIRVLGDYVILDTITSNTEQMVVENAGTGPALKVTQSGANSVAEFYDSESGVALFVGNNGNIGIGTNAPLAKLDLVGNLNLTGNIYKNGDLFAGGDTMPIGIIVPFYGTTVSDVSWLICDGSTYTRSNYIELADFLGVNPASSTFQVPDLRDKYLKGKGTGFAVKDVGGSNLKILSIANLPAHTHTGTTDSAGAHAHTVTVGYYNEGTQLNGFGIEDASTSFIGPVSAGTDTQGNHTHTFTTASTGSGTAFDIQPPYTVVNYIIKAKNNQYTTSIRAGDYWSNSNNEVFYQSGNIGIGTTKPQQLLDVNGSAVIRGNIGIGTTNPQSQLHVEGTTYISGNVGMGTTIPQAKLHINDTGAMIIPAGTTEQIPTIGVLGMIRFNTTLQKIQYYNEAGWASLGGVSALGGNTTIDLNGYRIHTYTSSSIFTVYSGGSVETLVVAGGGGGGWDVGGGGGAGGLRYLSSFIVPNGSYNIVVGSGGPGSSTVGAAPTAYKGQNSSFSSLVAIGGGGGGNYSGQNGGDGGSGGGASGYGNPGQPGNGTSGQGNRGGYANSGNTNANTGGGGGGAGGVGDNSIQNINSFVAGGIGLAYTISGSSVTYAQGGRGGADSWTGRVSGTANRGNGGDGGGNPNDGGAGGSGIVIIRYPI